MKLRKLGANGPHVSAVGLGCMGMSDLYGPADEKEGIATIHAALDAGVTLLDTGDFYGMGHNEMLIREALRGRLREQVQLSVKFGALRDPAGGWAGYDCCRHAYLLKQYVNPLCDSVLFRSRASSRPALSNLSTRCS